MGETKPETDREMLEDIRQLVANVAADVERLLGKVAELEAEFAPLARRAKRLTAAASALPGVGMGRRNGRDYTSS